MQFHRPRLALALLVLSPTASADAVYVFPPLVAESIHDEPVDGTGDSVNAAPENNLITHTSNAEDRAIHEFDASIAFPAFFAGSWLTGKIDAQDMNDTGVREFEFYVYAANGIAEASDFEIPGTLVGTAQFHPPLDTQLIYNFDVSAEVGALILAGHLDIGLRVQATSNSHQGDRISIVESFLQVAECATGGGYCYGDGSASACPCGAFGGFGEGCQNSSGNGASLNASGSASFSGDTLQFQVQGVPAMKPGLILRGDSQVSIPVGDGLLCTLGASQRSHIQITDSSGSTTFSDFQGAPFGSVANTGAETNFQYWYRDPSNTCSGQGFNFSNAYSITYTP